MTIRAIPLVRNSQLPNAVAAQYTCPASTSVVIKRVVFTNTDTSAHTVTAHVVPSGQSPSNSTMLINAQSLAAGPGTGSAYVSAELAGVVLSAGDTLQCFADAASKITINANGIQQT